MQEAGIQMAGIQTAGAQTVRKSEFGNASLIFTATLIWGTAFVAQSLGANHLAAFSFTAVRNLIGFLFLIPVTLLFRARGISVRPERENRPDNVFIPGRRGQRALVTKRELISGSILGVIVFVASNVQQLGIAGTTTAKAGFFTAMYVIFVPVLGIFLGKRVKKMIWGCVLLSVLGLYLLSIKGGHLSLNVSDGLELVSGLCFAVHIMYVGHRSSYCDGAVFAMIQFAVSSALSFVFALALEHPRIEDIGLAVFPLLYAGVLSSGVAFTLQIIGQRGMNPTLASILMCFESVISAVAGWFFLHQALSAIEILGCAVLFTAILLATLFGE
nr:EamA family transporter [Shuttleworthia satelles]